MRLSYLLPELPPGRVHQLQRKAIVDDGPDLGSQRREVGSLEPDGRKEDRHARRALPVPEHDREAGEIQQVVDRPEQAARRAQAVGNAGEWPREGHLEQRRRVERRDGGHRHRGQPDAHRDKWPQPAVAQPPDRRRPTQKTDDEQREHPEPEVVVSLDLLRTQGRTLGSSRDPCVIGLIGAFRFIEKRP